MVRFHVMALEDSVVAILSLSTTMGEIMNSKQQGDIGVAMAIAYYTKNEYAVSVPMGDNTLYDLIVDKTRLLRVQVKTTSYKRGNNYVVQLATSGGNQSWNGNAKKLSAENSDRKSVV